MNFEEGDLFVEILLKTFQSDGRITYFLFKTANQS